MLFRYALRHFKNSAKLLFVQRQAKKSYENATLQWRKRVMETDLKSVRQFMNLPVLPSTWIRLVTVALWEILNAKGCQSKSAEKDVLLNLEKKSVMKRRYLFSHHIYVI